VPSAAHKDGGAYDLPPIPGPLVARRPAVDARDLQEVAAPEERDQLVRLAQTVGLLDAPHPELIRLNAHLLQLRRRERAEQAARDVGDETAEAVDVDNLAVQARLARRVPFPARPE